jgi:8-oxo-dGTP pyrophosphatase MutT (NUDIX family)
VGENKRALRRVLPDAEGWYALRWDETLARQSMLKMPLPLRAVARVLKHVRGFIWRFTGTPPGVHAIAITPSGSVVLVKLNYANGWRCPGGGIKSGESPEAAIVRELQEEIGMTACGSLERLEAQDHQNIFLVRGVDYSFKPSLEIRSVREFRRGELPDDLRPRSWRAVLERVQETT